MIQTRNSNLNISSLRNVIAKGDKLKYTVLIEKDKDGYYVADVPELPGCHTQAKNLNELNKRIKEAISVYLKASKANKLHKKHLTEFLGVQLIEA